jgi:hypothetical protein
VTFDDDDKVVGTPKTDSKLYGFHPFNFWKHSNERSYVSLNDERTGGHAYISGDLTFSLSGMGVGDLATKEVNTTMSF